MKNFLIFLILFLVSLNLFSQESLTIDQAISFALNFNPEIKKLNEKLKGVEGKRMQLEAFPNPELIFSREGLRIGSNLESEVNLGIFQTFELFGKRKLRKKIGEIEEDIARLEIERIKRVIEAKVKKSYFRASFIKQKIKLLEDTEEIIKEYIESATFKYQAGEVSLTDIVRGKIESLKLKNEVLEAKKELETEISELGRIMGKRLNGNVEFTSPFQFNKFGKSLNELLKEIETLPAVEIGELKLQISRKGLELSQKNFYPDWRIGFFYPSIKKGGWGFEFGLSIPVFQKGLKGVLIEANSLNLENQISFEQIKREVSSKIESLYYSLKVSEEMIENYEKSVFPELETLFLSSLSYYQNGVISALEFFDILRTFKTAKIEYKKEILNHICLIADIESAGQEE